MKNQSLYGKVFYLPIICLSLFFSISWAEDQNKEMEESVKNLTLDLTVGDIVAQKCSLSRVFEKYQIDYCCGGKVTLREVCLKKRIDPQVILDELESQMNIKTDEKLWMKESLSDLIDHIQMTHHHYLLTELPQLSLLVEKVVKVHESQHPELIEIRDIYVNLRAELEAHLLKEDNEVFPAIKKLEALQKNDNLLPDLIAQLEQEHDDAGGAFHRLRELTHDYTPPENACNSYRVMLSRLEELECDMHRHVHKENSILFPRVQLMKDTHLIQK